jgi:hypothetical protein
MAADNYIIRHFSTGFSHQADGIFFVGEHDRKEKKL